MGIARCTVLKLILSVSVVALIKIAIHELATHIKGRCIDIYIYIFQSSDLNSQEMPL